MKKIVLTGGGTAGHVVPNLSLIPYLKKYFDEIYYIGSIGGMEEELVKKAGLKFYGVPCVKLKRRELIKNLSIPFKLLDGIIKAKKILKDIAPDVVFSKGGYVALPVVIASKKLNIPVISHESDFNMGLANKISAKFSQKVLTSFSETKNEVKNGKFIGPPIKDGLTGYDKSAMLREFRFNEDKPVLLVFGGSQGALAINDTLKDALPELLKHYNVLHITGKKNYEGKNIATGYTEVPFVSDMAKAYSVANVIISRCGSNSAFEILSLKIPVVFIPLPKGVSRGDQELNANYFERMGLCHVLKESSLTAASLIYAVNSAYANRRNVKNNPTIIKSASDDIAKLLNEATLK